MIAFGSPVPGAGTNNLAAGVGAAALAPLFLIVCLQPLEAPACSFFPDTLGSPDNPQFCVIS